MYPPPHRRCSTVSIAGTLAWIFLLVGVGAKAWMRNGDLMCSLSECCYMGYCSSCTSLPASPAPRPVCHSLLFCWDAHRHRPDCVHHAPVFALTRRCAPPFLCSRCLTGEYVLCAPPAPQSAPTRWATPTLTRLSSSPSSLGWRSASPSRCCSSFSPSTCCPHATLGRTASGRLDGTSPSLFVRAARACYARTASIRLCTSLCANFGAPIQSVSRRPFAWLACCVAHCSTNGQAQSIRLCTSLVANCGAPMLSVSSFAGLAACGAHCSANGQA